MVNTANHNAKVFEVFKNLKTYGYHTKQFVDMANCLGVYNADGIYQASLVAILISPSQACKTCNESFMHNKELHEFFEVFINHNVDSHSHLLTDAKGRMTVAAEISTVTILLERIIGDKFEELFNEEFFCWVENKIEEEEHKKTTNGLREPSNADLY